MATAANPVTQPFPTEWTAIYVVDDDAMIRTVMLYLLLNAGYGTKVFGDPLEALDALRAAKPPPTLLITDLHMPGMDGVELIERARSVHPELRTVLMSGMLDVLEAPRTAHAADRCLGKPMSRDALLEAVAALLSGPSTQPRPTSKPRTFRSWPANLPPSSERAG